MILQRWKSWPIIKRFFTNNDVIDIMNVVVIELLIVLSLIVDL